MQLDEAAVSEGVFMDTDADRRLSVMLAEYAQAQASAEHYNSLLWQVISIFTAANAVLLAGAGSVLVLAVGEPLRWPFLLTAAVVGLVMNVACLRFTHVFRSFQNQKLERCRKLEKAINSECKTHMQQHRALRQFPHVHRIWYYTLQGTLLLAWSALLAISIHGL